MATACPSADVHMRDANIPTDNDLVFLEFEKNHPPKRRHSIAIPNCKPNCNQELNGNQTARSNYSSNPKNLKSSTLSNSFRTQSKPFKLAEECDNHIQMCSKQNSQSMNDENMFFSLDSSHENPTTVVDIENLNFDGSRKEEVLSLHCLKKNGENQNALYSNCKDNIGSQFPLDNNKGSLNNCEFGSDSDLEQRNTQCLQCIEEDHKGLMMYNHNKPLCSSNNDKFDECSNCANKNYSIENNHNGLSTLERETRDNDDLQYFDVILNDGRDTLKLENIADCRNNSLDNKGNNVCAENNYPFNGKENTFVPSGMQESEFSDHDLPNKNISVGQSRCNEMKSKTGNVDSNFLNVECCNAGLNTCNGSKKTVILDNQSDRKPSHSSLDVDNAKVLSFSNEIDLNNQKFIDDELEHKVEIGLVRQRSQQNENVDEFNKARKQDRPKSLTLDYRYLKKARNLDCNSRRFFEKSDQFDDRFFNGNNTERKLVDESFRKIRGNKINDKTEYTNGHQSKSDKFNPINEELQLLQSNLEEFGNKHNCQNLGGPNFKENSKPKKCNQEDDLSCQVHSRTNPIHILGNSEMCDGGCQLQNEAANLHINSSQAIKHNSIKSQSFREELQTGTIHRNDLIGNESKFIQPDGIKYAKSINNLNVIESINGMVSNKYVLPDPIQMNNDFLKPGKIFNEPNCSSHEKENNGHCNKYGYSQFPDEMNEPQFLVESAPAMNNSISLDDFFLHENNSLQNADSYNKLHDKERLQKDVACSNQFISNALEDDYPESHVPCAKFSNNQNIMRDDFSFPSKQGFGSKGLEDLLIDVNGGSATTNGADLLDLNETTLSENEAMDVLLQLDEVLNECLKESGGCCNSLADCTGFSDDFVNKNHDEYRLSRQISLEELEGKKTNCDLEDNDESSLRNNVDLGTLGFGLLKRQFGSKDIKTDELEDPLAGLINPGSFGPDFVSSLKSNGLERNFERIEGNEWQDIPSHAAGGSRRNFDHFEGCSRHNSISDFREMPNDLQNWNGFNSLSRVVKLQELEGRAKMEDMQYCLKGNDSGRNREYRFEYNNADFSNNIPDFKNLDNRSSLLHDEAAKLDKRDITIEECLQDLDEYLRAFDDESIGSMSLVPQIQGNQALGKSYCNLGYINNELDKTESDTQRPLSSCGSRAGTLTRNHAYRATIGAIKCGGGEERATVLHRSAPAHVDNPSARRTSEADGDEVIDWSWLNDVEGVDNAEIIENHRPSTSVVVEGSMATGDAKRPIWLRTSMRRLQPLPLPTNVDNADHAPATSSAMDNLTPADTNFLTGGRPISAPSRLPSVQRSRSRDRTSQNPAGRARSSSASSRSRRPRSLSSSVSSVVSSVDSTPTCTPTPAQTYNTNTTEETNNNNNNARRSCERPARNNDMPEAESPLGQWPHSLSSTLAYIGCTLGIFNISRFAILSIHFGANFIFQFLIITFFIGLPIFTLQLCLGQQLGAGVIDMWKISPMFQGVGVSLLFFQALTGIYSIIGVSWMFVYFRDSFVTKFERYRWAEPFVYYRHDIQPPINGSYKLTETIPDYLSGIVFQRHHLVSGNTYGTIKFQPAFNLAVVWMIVFVSLSKGLRSYGKVIYVFTLLPIFGTFVLCAKLLGMMPQELINNVFPETSWNEFFINPRSWLAACQEAFLTWGMLGAAVMQIASHNKNKHLLQRDSSLIAVITVTILLLVAFLANTCVQILKANGFSYQPDSFEKLSTYAFMRHKSDPLPPNLASTPVKYMVHNSFIVGDRINRPGYDSATESGYQVLRFATELIPATFAILGTDQVSPFWTVLFYFILILFGIAQQLAIWHCVITGIMAIKAKVLKSWETTITFFSCACGFILGLPMTTEFGIYVVYFMDLAIGGVWWLILIILLQIIAVFMVRGRPYSGDTLVTVLFHSNNYKCLLSWAPALLSFTWNVVLPVVLMVWCIAFFKNGNFRELFIWHHGPSLEYWPLWARQIGALLQLIPVLAVPFIAVIQSYRYLNNGPNDILDRIQLLYRPPLGEHMDDLAIQEAAAATNNNTTSPTTNIIAEDPPPKYTPPPSYTTATGARIAKMLRQSIRRSVRRIANVLGESSGTRSRNTATTSQTQEPPPPDYNAVLVEMNQNQRDISITIPDGPYSRNTIQRELATIATSSTGLTAADVACILRSSFRRSTVRTLRRNNTGTDQSMSSLSAENLIDSAAPIGETSLVLGLTSDSDDKDGNNTSSVI